MNSTPNSDTPTPQFLIRGIPAAFVERMWPFAEPYIKRALDHTAGELECADLLAGCLARDVQLWMVADGQRIIGAATTEIVIYPHKKHCRIITIAGSNFLEWAPLADALILEWAGSFGCDGIEANVRRGFAPKLAPLGYKHLHSVIHKKIAIMQESNTEANRSATWAKAAEAAATALKQ